MLKILGIILAVFIFFTYVIPYLRIKKSENQIKKAFNKLDSNRYKIIQDLIIKNNNDKFTKEYHIDYVIVSIYGIFLIKKKVFPKYFALLKGNVSNNTWHYRAFFRFSNAPNIKPDKWHYWDTHNYKFPNPILELNKITDLIEDNSKISKENIIPIVLTLPKIKNVSIKGIYDVKSEVVKPSLIYDEITKYDKEIMSKEDNKNMYNKLLTLKQQELT